MPGREPPEGLLLMKADLAVFFTIVDRVGRDEALLLLLIRALRIRDRLLELRLNDLAWMLRASNRRVIGWLDHLVRERHVVYTVRDFHGLPRVRVEIVGTDVLKLFYLYGGWTVAYYVDVTPAAVRFSTDGKAFRTVSAEERVAFDHADGNRLVLRFVLDDGSEVEYAGAVDYGAVAVAASRAALFERGKFTCHHDKAGAVACVFHRLDNHSMSAYYTVDEALGVLRSVDYGCSRDSLDHRDNLDTHREAKRSTYEAFRLQVKASCDTVFARFALADGSQSPLLVAPVSSEER